MKQDFDKSGPFFAIGGLAVAFFLYAYSAIALPSVLNSVVLPLVWVALLVIATRWFTSRPRASTLLPLVALVVWFGVMLLVPRS